MIDARLILVSILCYLLAVSILGYRLHRAGYSRHPALVILALGTYTSLFGLHSSLDIAYEFGFGFLAYFLGAAGAFLLAPVLLMPIHRLSQRHQLFSLPDLLAFRYRSQTSSSIATLSLLTALMLLLALQFRLMTDLFALLSGSPMSSAHMLIIILVLIGASLLLIGRREADKAPIMIPVLAVESVIRLALLLLLGSILLWTHFGGPVGLDDWIRENGQRISAMERHLADDPWRALLLLFFGAPLLLPPLFHILFAYKSPSNTLFKASWGAPLLLLIASLPIPVFIWSAIHLATPTSPELYIIGTTLQTSGVPLALMVLVTLFSSGLLFALVCNLSATSMSLNHLVLPWLSPTGKTDIYGWLKRSKMLLLILIPFLAWLLSSALPNSLNATHLLILAFSLLMQCLPGTLALMYWPQGNNKGFLSGLVAGCTGWLLLLGLPWLSGGDFLLAPAWQLDTLGNSYENWHLYLLFISTLNILTFVVVSLTSTTSAEEQASSRACSIDSFPENELLELSAHNVDEFRERLEQSLGEVAAQRELDKALRLLNLDATEQRPLALKRLRQQIEANLSGLLGPTIARRLVIQSLDQPSTSALRLQPDRQLLESQLEAYHSRLSGLAAELDNLRRYHRQILQELPLAACTLNPRFEILMWNQSMVNLTGLEEDDILGSPLSLLPQPWASLLLEFANSRQTHISKKALPEQGQTRWFNLNKAQLNRPENLSGDWVILIEDCTETQRLEQELAHNERLASIGRLAAGVAHEIGNPITGIACLAQNLKLARDNDEVLETAAQIHEQTERISRILQTLMNFARSGTDLSATIKEQVSLHKCAAEAIQLLVLDREARGVKYLNLIDLDLRVPGDPQRLSQVFVNLLTNARDACEDGDTITLQSQVDGQQAVIEVIDPGCGIPAEDVDRLFEPFYTTKAPGQGTGLGLSLVYGIIEEHGGHIRVQSPGPDGSGTCMILVLPLTPESVSEPQEQTGNS